MYYACHESDESLPRSMTLPGPCRPDVTRALMSYCLATGSHEAGLRSQSCSRASRHCSTLVASLSQASPMRRTGVADAVSRMSALSRSLHRVLNSQSVSKAMHPPPEAASPCPGTATCRLDEKTSGKIFQTSGGWGNRQWLIAVRERVFRMKTFARRQTAWRRCCESQELQLRSSLPFCRQLFAALALSSPVCWMRTSLVCCP